MLEYADTDENICACVGSKNINGIVYGAWNTQGTLEHTHTSNQARLMNEPSRSFLATYIQGPLTPIHSRARPHQESSSAYERIF
ncbi:hypothetical protein E2C01_096234 [Portunus trituberculatus]|uniref:Uncharacterized protein n=1 Tax=Portunus trituberculatus TaxID=210409 RepID=A0A5B7K180_PORTR|nr:hypothetical protein [Portunus trituberculatus]